MENKHNKYSTLLVGISYSFSCIILLMSTRRDCGHNQADTLFQTAYSKTYILRL